MAEVIHEITAEGESTVNWALFSPGFRGTVKQLTCCGRCGEGLRGGRHTKHHVAHVFPPTMHWLCDTCYDALPDIPDEPHTEQSKDYTK